MATKGQVELCAWTGEKWTPIPNGLDDLKLLVSSALIRLESFSKRRDEARYHRALEMASIMATMPDDDSEGVDVWEDEGGKSV